MPILKNVDKDLGRLGLCMWPLLAALSGCAYQPSIENPEVTLAGYPATGDAAVEQVDAPTEEWWRRYESDELNRLFDELNARSLDLAAAREQVRQAKALLGQQRADNWPTLDGSLSQRSSHDFDTSDTDDGSSLSFSAGYEVDLWGSRSAANYNAQMQVVAAQQELQSLRLQLQAGLAQGYFTVLALQERMDIAEQNLKASKDLLDLIQLQFEQGSASGIELFQQKNTYLSNQTSLLAIQRSLVTAKRALAVILGRDSLQLADVSMGFSDLTLPHVSLVQPAALLEFRPDILLAETTLRVTEASLYQEKKKRWPTLNLSAGLSVDDVLNGGSDWVGSLVGSLAAPIFDGGRIRNEIAAADSDLSIAQLNYRQVVMIAMQDTLETLSELSYQVDLLGARERELDNSYQLYELARLRYESGDTDFINLLDAQRSWFSARDNMLQARTSQLSSTVDVFRAMGVAPDVE